MFAFVLRRLASFIATLAAASLVVFAVLEVLPGNPAEVMLGDSATPESLAALEARLGLNRPAATRYLDWVGGLLQGRSAQSYARECCEAAKGAWRQGRRRSGTVWGLGSARDRV